MKFITKSKTKKLNRSLKKWFWKFILIFQCSLTNWKENSGKILLIKN